MWSIFAVLFLAYLIGSIPTAVWVGKLFFDVDVRDHGSGNAGASNTFRVLGTGPGVAVLVVDCFKGWLGVRLAHWFLVMPDSTDALLVLGLMTVLGHIFPAYAQFRGGKGIATILGVMLAIHPQATLLAMGVFIITVTITRYISVGSMLAAFSLPCWLIFRFHVDERGLILATIGMFFLVVFTHRKNIHRLMDGTENRLKFSSKKADES